MYKVVIYTSSLFLQENCDVTSMRGLTHLLLLPSVEQSMHVVPNCLQEDAAEHVKDARHKSVDVLSTAWTNPNLEVKED